MTTEREEHDSMTTKTTAPAEGIDNSGRRFTLPGPFPTLAHVKRANADHGYHFFEPDTMRFFASRIAPGVIAGRIFISSEQFRPFAGPADPRRWTVRVMHDDGQVGELGAFQQYASLRAARRDAERFVAGQPIFPSVP
jgi:hypothetical protein